MAGTDSQLSKAVQDLLRRVREEGSITALMAELSGDFQEVELVPSSQDHGSMTDASKRRMTEAEQEPIRRRSSPVQNSSGHGYELLPSGVKSFEQWGTTIIEAGKFGKQEMTYNELASSSETSHVKYVSWMLNQSGREDLSPVIRDLANYLVMFNRRATSSSPVYPGSSTTRRFKA